ncbi:MAG TPA: M14 metallopeptidase family protein, partial [Gemmatimonadaceae bacterium]
MIRRAFLAVVSIVVAAHAAHAQGKITSPKEQFGHEIGEDYFLANYDQLVKYWDKLDRESNRMRVVRIGTTAEGRPMMMAIITSPENFPKLARYQEIVTKLARAEGVTESQARELAREGKAVVWIDGGLHATEVLGAQQLIQFVYEMVSKNDPETVRFLRDDILLATLVNPDGMDLVSNWYMRDSVKTNRSTQGIPRLYQKYAGHDNNRDSYMASQPETQAVDSILYRAWYPQIVYNHHQTGPAGTVIFAPPFRDPFNYNFDPLVPVGIDLVGAAMHSRFIQEGKPGSTMRSGSNYSTWWNGGLRTTVYFHNMIGLLTEAIGNPTPMEIPLVPDRLLPSGALPYPIMPQKWHFAQSIAYELSANRAVMDIASKYREDFLFNAWRMGMNSIERGNRDSWTLRPELVANVKDAVSKADNPRQPGPSEKYIGVLKNPAERDPRGYIIPADQPDFATAVKFINALVKNGIDIHRATSSFTVGSKQYPAGSYIVKTAQAFRPHVIDMFEPQNHPNDIPYPGGPPTPPYDNAGWTLAYQMGVKFDRILDPFTGPFQKLVGYAPVPAGVIAAAPIPNGATWFSWSRTTNDAFVAVNRLLKAGEAVYTGSPSGWFYVANTPAARNILGQVAATRGVNFGAASPPDTSKLTRLRAPRIALWDVYGGEISSGWMRFVFDQFEFPYDVVFANDIDNTDLSSKYDVLILPDGARLAAQVDSTQTFQPRGQPPADKIPAEWRSKLGRISVAKSLPRIRSFVENGGTLLALGDASEIGYNLGLPLKNAIVDESGKQLPSAKYYVPGSVLEVAVDTTSAIAWGMSSPVDIFYDNDRAFRIDSGNPNVKQVAWFASETPLRSGWAWGQKVLNGAAEIVTAPLGKGQVVLYGPQV